MAVGLPIGTRNIKSGIQRNPKTQPIPTGPSQTVGVARDPGVAGGPGNVPVGAFGTEGGVGFGRAIQGLSNTVIAEERAKQAALVAAQQREDAKIETVFMETLSNKYGKSIESADIKFNPLDKGATIKAQGIYTPIMASIMKLAEGQSESFKTRLALKIQIAVMSGSANGQTLIEDLLKAEELAYPLREGLELDVWADMRLEEMQKLTGAHFDRLVDVPTKSNKAMLNTMFNDVTIQGIMGEKIGEYKEKLLEIDQIAADKKFDDPVQVAIRKLAAVDKVLIEKGGTATDPVQAAQILSPHFKLSDAQQIASDEVKRQAKVNFIKLSVNRVLEANNLPPMDVHQELKLENSGTYELTAAEQGTQEGKSKKAELTAIVGEENVTPELLERVAAPGGPTTTINMAPREKAFETGTGTIQSKMLGANIDIAATAVDTGFHIESIRQGLATHAFEPGAFAETRVFFSTVAELVERTTGADLTKLKKALGSAPAGNLMDTAAKNLTLQMAKDVGRITNMSLRFSEQSVPGLFRTRAGMEIIVELLQRKVDRDKAVGLLSEDAQLHGIHPKIGPSFYQRVRDYDKANPLFDAKLKAKMLAISNKGKSKADKVKASDIEIKPPSPKGFKFEATINGYHRYTGPDGKDYRMPVEGSTPVPEATTTVTPEDEPAQEITKDSSLSDVMSKVSVDQVQSVITDLAEKIDPKTLQGILFGIQELFKGGNK
jgi:hypothetical protein